MSIHEDQRELTGGIGGVSRISTIVFDVGGVLLTNGWDRTGRNAVLKQFGLDQDEDREEFERRHTDANDEWEKGWITSEEYMARTLFYKSREFMPQDFLEAMKAQSILLPGGAMGILQQIAASEQWLMAMLNNEARELNDYRLEKFKLRQYFKCCFSSCYVAQRKPQPRIYQIALDVLQCSPDEVVFIDDRAENVKPALALGIHGIQFQNIEQLKADLAELGVKF